MKLLTQAMNRLSLKKLKSLVPARPLIILNSLSYLDKNTWLLLALIQQPFTEDRTGLCTCIVTTRQAR